MDNKKIIREQLNAIGAPVGVRDHFVVYYYILLLDDKPCLKSGKTIDVIDKRIYSYLFNEHPLQKKDMDTFRMLGVFNFEDKATMSSMEKLMNSKFSKYPLTIGQHGNTEQFDLVKIKNVLLRAMKGCEGFSTKWWLADDVEMNIDKVIASAPTIDNVVTSASNDIVSVSRYQTRSVTLPRYQTRSVTNNVTHVTSVKTSSANDLYIERITKLLNFDYDEAQGVGIKTVEALVSAHGKSPFVMTDIEILCHDIKTKMCRENESPRTNAVIKYIRGK